MAYNFIPALYMLQGMDNVHFQGRGRGVVPENSVEKITCECTRPNTTVHCNVCGYVTVGRIRKHCPRHPTVSVFTTGFLFVGAFEELRKVTVTFVMSVRPSAWNNLAFTWRIFMKFCLSILFQNTSKIGILIIKILQD
jgi:hypothetical protein